MMKILITVVVVVVAMVGLAVLVATAGWFEVAADTPHGGLSAWYLEMARESSIEGRIGSIEVPTLGPRRAAAGAAAYAEMCAGCHGSPGVRPGVVGRGLNPSPPDLAEEAWEETEHQAEAFWIIKHGIRMTGMPAFGETHSDEALWDLVAFLGELPEMDGAAYERLLASGRGAGGGHEGHEHGDHSAEEAAGEHDEAGAGIAVGEHVDDGDHDQH